MGCSSLKGELAATLYFPKRREFISNRFEIVGNFLP
jgi:hypothetical protein